MRSMSETLARLAKLRAMQQPARSSSSKLADLGAFGSNPGMLEARIHVPADLAERPGMVVVLHGCTQDAAAYEQGSGWSRLADDYGFVVLYPQQTRQNNANACFNWFLPADIRRGEGEALSIRQMIDTAVKLHDIDPSRIFVTGLSAGGAMANVMLATYPEVFSGGAIIAGLPYNSARTVPEAFDRMRGHGIPIAAKLQGELRLASGHHGPWPTISVWHGTSDNTVVPENGQAIVTQWQGVHGVDSCPANVEREETHTVTSWKNPEGAVVIEHIAIAGMAHGTPIDASDGYGRSAAYMLDVGYSSTLHCARSWGLTPSFERRVPNPDAASASVQPSRDAGASQADANGIQRIIEDALRSAGLMK